jgi:hypothetical protein
MSHAPSLGTNHLERRTGYARLGGERIAYEVLGTGATDLVFTPGSFGAFDASYDAGPTGMLFAATKPMRTAGLILVNTGAKYLASDLAARIMSAAQANEILVSRTVKDLVVGSDIAFADRGTHYLKGIDGAWNLFAVP